MSDDLVKRLCKEADYWGDDLLYSAVDRIEKLEKVLKCVIEHCFIMEKQITENGFRVDFCGESSVLTDARAALEEMKNVK